MSVRMREFFFDNHMMQMVKFSNWNGSISNRSDYLFHSLFLDYIFLL